MQHAAAPSTTLTILIILLANQAATLTSATVCDIFDAANTPCVAAHSTTRKLFTKFSGPLYQITRAFDHTSVNITTLPSGYADASIQDSFCAAADAGCIIDTIYDQSFHKNHLTLAPPGGAHNLPDTGVDAMKLPLTLNGHKVYAAYFEGGGHREVTMGYRNDKTSGVATGDDPETLYMVTSGRHYNGGCCFDYGNAEINNLDTGAGSMEAIYFGNSTVWGKGQGKGPWIMADLENGLWAGSERYGPGYAVDADYVTAMVKGDSGNHFSLKGGNAQSGKLKILYDGVRPKGYSPMKKQGAIILGIGGDNSNSAIGTFYEGVMTKGYTSDVTDDAVQANIVAAGYV